MERHVLCVTILVEFNRVYILSYVKFWKSRSRWCCFPLPTPTVIILSSLLICDKPLAVHKPLQLNPNSASSCSFYTASINVLEIKVGDYTVEARNGA